MHHLAILSREQRLLTKILSGEKVVESRWYKHSKPPHNIIKAGDTVYFKESGLAVSAQANVARVITVENLDANKITSIINTYGALIGIDQSFAARVKDKNICVLIFLESVKAIKPFNINKKGYGIMNAWITIKNIDEIKA